MQSRLYIRPNDNKVPHFLFRDAEGVFGSRGLCLRTFLTLTVPFAACWAVTNYLYVYALGLIAAADVTAIFSSNTAFIYVFSWLWLHERLVLLPVRVSYVDPPHTLFLIQNFVSE